MTRPLRFVVFLLLAAACGEGRPSTSTPTTPSPSPTFTLSGVVYESTFDGRRPLADAEVDVSTEHQINPPQATTGAGGRYQLSGITQRAVKVIATKAGYSQPCRAAIALTGNNVLDVYLVSDAILSTTGVPSSMPVVQPTLSGLVFERTPQGIQSVGGAGVVADFSGGNGWAPSARTMTDAAGRYLLCGAASVFPLEVGVSKAGYSQSSRLVEPPARGNVDFELARQ